MPAAATQNQVVIYTPIQSAEQTRDLLLLEQERWKPYCGILTRANVRRYLANVLYGSYWLGPGVDIHDTQYVDCCWGDPMAIIIYAYPLDDDVRYRLTATAGRMSEPVLQTNYELQSLSFNMEAEVSIPHPAVAIKRARWLTGPWTRGGEDVSAPGLIVEGRVVRSPIPLYGSVELVLEIRRWRHILSIGKAEAADLLINGWAEFAVGLPDGGRPVALELEPPPGAEDMAKLGGDCSRPQRPPRLKWREPEEEPPKAQGEDKHIKCKYCELKCEDPDDQERA